MGFFSFVLHSSFFYLFNTWHGNGYGHGTGRGKVGRRVREADATAAAGPAANYFTSYVL